MKCAFGSEIYDVAGPLPTLAKEFSAIGPNGEEETIIKIRFSSIGQNVGTPIWAKCRSGRELGFSQDTRKFIGEWHLPHVPGLGQGEAMDEKFFGCGEKTNIGQGGRGRSKKPPASKDTAKHKTKLLVKKRKREKGKRLVKWF